MHSGSGLDLIYGAAGHSDVRNVSGPIAVYVYEHEPF